jgi:hypothetical protein
MNREPGLSALLIESGDWFVFHKLMEWSSTVHFSWRWPWCDQGFNGADLRNVCTEAGMFAIRAMRDYVIQEDFMKVCKLTKCKVKVFHTGFLSRNFTPFLLLRHLNSVDIRRYPRRWWIGPMLWWYKQIFAASDLVVVWSIWSASVAAANVGLTVGLQAVRKLNDAKKLESSAHYSADFGKE